jgi:hypothetical protein
MLTLSCELLARHTWGSNPPSAAAPQVSSHKKNALEQFVFGSVSRHVAKHCKQPTLVFQGDSMTAAPA